MSDPITEHHPDQVRLQSALVMAFGYQKKYEVRVCELKPSEDERYIIMIGMIDTEATPPRYVVSPIPREFFDDNLQLLAGYLRDRMPEMLSHVRS